ncbi:MAG: pseudouridine synthase [Candidatus Falkowbacteria bacterium]
MKMILQKVIAASGYCSRRKGEELIRNGVVNINGRQALIGEEADPINDKITINGRLISSPEKMVYVILNKPLGYTCTNRKFANEQNIFDLVDLPTRLFAVGRLDKDSHGLILLTNDGDLTLKLSHPRYEHDKEYEVKIRDEVINPEMVIKELLGGVDIGDGDGVVKAVRAKYLQNDLFVITLNEGKKRQIRRMFDVLGTRVIDLKRISLGSLSLGGLPEGKWDYLTDEEIDNLKR